MAWRKLLDGLRYFAPLSILRVLVIIGGAACGGWNPHRGFRHGGWPAVLVLLLIGFWVLNAGAKPEFRAFSRHLFALTASHFSQSIEK
ncbi:protein of unknown function [Pseudomonas marincola]|uniref:Uncharacterized protein n=1 Tax=Pseudomonas marincola TaxID=437900 RepID=A0A8S2BFD0_9PSED|nr:protein of unknown function [Pseudomonas marincola]